MTFNREKNTLKEWKNPWYYQ